MEAAIWLDAAVWRPWAGTEADELGRGMAGWGFGVILRSSSYESSLTPNPSPSFSLSLPWRVGGSAHTEKVVVVCGQVFCSEGS